MVALDAASSCSSTPKWEVELPNALYRVGVGYADPAGPVVTGCVLEGVPAFEEPIVLNPDGSYEFVAIIQLQDGRLTFEGDYATCNSVSCTC